MKLRHMSFLAVLLACSAATVASAGVTIEYTFWAEPTVNTTYGSTEICPVRLYVGYQPADPLFPVLDFWLADPTTGRGLFMDQVTGIPHQDNPNPNGISLYTYIFEWPVPMRSQVPFSVGDGQIAYYKLVALDPTNDENAIAFSDLVGFAFHGKQSIYPVPYHDLGDLFGPHKSKNDELTETWGGVKSLYR